MRSPGRERLTGACDLRHADHAERARFIWIILWAGIWATGCGGDQEPGWGWKRATSTDDLIDFVNGAGAYAVPVAEFRLSAARREGGVDFFVFYRRPTTGETPAPWGWKLATGVDDAHQFLNGTGAYQRPVHDAQIAAVLVGGAPHFYIVYQAGTTGDVPGGWGWKRSTDPSDVMRFLNGQEPYRHPVTTARIAELSTGAHDDFYVFYRQSTLGGAIGNWAWKRSTDPDDALRFVNGVDPYGDPVGGFELGAMQRGAWVDFHVFYNKGTAVWLQSPLRDERFVSQEPISLRAILTSDRPSDGSALRWTSSVAGDLGSGPQLMVGTLSVGTHQLEVTGYGVSARLPVRVFPDLWELYRAAPAAEEIGRIRSRFTLAKIDGAGVDERWALYSGLRFDQTSTDPTEMAAIAKLDVLRHQRFAQPLPFTGGRSLYEHFTSHVHTLSLHLDCRLNSGGGGYIYLSRNFSVWDPRLGTSAADPDACKRPFATFELYPYFWSLQLLVHEGRHSEPDDPGHGFCDGRPKDATLEGGSGYAQGALYAMWVYKYSLYDPPAIRELARDAAMGALRGIFCSTPTHSDPRVQAIVDELLGH